MKKIKLPKDILFDILEAYEFSDYKKLKETGELIQKYQNVSEKVAKQQANLIKREFSDIIIETTHDDIYKVREEIKKLKGYPLIVSYNIDGRGFKLILKQEDETTNN